MYSSAQAGIMDITKVGIILIRHSATDHDLHGKRLQGHNRMEHALRVIVGKIMAIILSKRQQEVLQMMADGEELVQSRDHKGWPQYWVDLIRVHHKTWWTLVENVLISTSDDFSSRTVYWHINESGKKLLSGETKIYPIYNKKGNLEYVESWH